MASARSCWRPARSPGAPRAAMAASSPIRRPRWVLASSSRATASTRPGASSPSCARRRTIRWRWRARRDSTSASRATGPSTPPIIRASPPASRPRPRPMPGSASGRGSYSRDEFREIGHGGTEQFGGFWVEGGGGLHPLAYAIGFAEAAERRGARLFADSPGRPLGAPGRAAPPRHPGRHRHGQARRRRHQWLDAGRPAQGARRRASGRLCPTSS